MDHRLFDRRDIKTPQQQFAADLCRQAGVRYRGIQSGFGIVADQILVDNAYGSTLCVPIPDCTVEKLRQVVAASNAAWVEQFVTLVAPNIIRAAAKLEAKLPSIKTTTKRTVVVGGKYIFHEEVDQ